MYVSVVNQHGREEEVNTDKVDYTMSDRDTLFVGQTPRPRPISSDRIQSGKLVTHLLSDPTFVDLRDGFRGYVLNLDSLQWVDFDTRAGTIFINFGTGTQVKLPISKRDVFEQALLQYPASGGTPSPKFVNLGDGFKDYVLNLNDFQWADFDTTARVIFVNFGTGAQIKVPMSHKAVFEQALVSYRRSQDIASGGVPPKFSTRWKRRRFAQ